MGTFSWLGGSGNWTDDNWSIIGPSATIFPGSADSAILGGAGSYTVTVAGFATQVHDFTLTDASAELQLATEFVVGGLMTINAGTVSIDASIILDAPTLTNDGIILSAGLGANSSQIAVTSGFTNNGTMTVDGDRVSVATFTSAFDNAGTIEITNLGSLGITTADTFDNSNLFMLSSGATLSLGVPSVASRSGDIQFSDGSASELILGGLLPTVPTTVEDFQPGNIIDLTNTLTFDVSETASLTGDSIAVSDHGSIVLTIPVAGIPSTNSIDVSNDGAGWAELTTALACFAAGTHIRTMNGDVPVEALTVGECVPAHFAGPTAIEWIGHRRIDCGRHPKSADVWPVRIAADAFGPGEPCRDLWLSPDHALFVNGVLIPVKYLVNGSTIAQIPVDEVVYYHVALARHDAILAEGLAAESYLDDGDRSDFTNGGSVVRLHPDFARSGDVNTLLWEARGCAPLVVTGPELTALKQLLRDREELALRAMPSGDYLSRLSHRPGEMAGDLVA